MRLLEFERWHRYVLVWGRVYRRHELHRGDLHRRRELHNQLERRRSIELLVHWGRHLFGGHFIRSDDDGQWVNRWFKREHGIDFRGRYRRWFDDHVGFELWQF